MNNFFPKHPIQDANENATLHSKCQKFLQEFDVDFGKKEVSPISFSFFRLYEIGLFPSQQKGLSDNMKTTGSMQQVNKSHSCEHGLIQAFELRQGDLNPKVTKPQRFYYLESGGFSQRLMKQLINDQ